jgi:hypothetical protein
MPVIPTYVRDEIVLRLTSPRLQHRKLKAICRLLEIDLDAALDPGPGVDDVVNEFPLSVQGAAEYTGAVSFGFETRCGNHVREVLGRVVYASEGLNAIGQIERTTSTCQALVWDLGEPAPEWQPMLENTLPDGLVQRLSEVVLDAVIEQQRQSEGEQRD